MTNPYPMLTYHGDMSAIPIGSLMGFDEVFRPYEVIDTVFSQFDCKVCGHNDEHTHVYLQYATPETVGANAEQYQTAIAVEMMRRQAHERKVLSRGPAR